jgi:hypothetical protein
VSELARDAILTVTLLILVHVFASLHVTPRADGVPYCAITYKAAAYDEYGQLHKGWAHGYGPCTLLDRYENT